MTKKCPECGYNLFPVTYDPYGDTIDAWNCPPCGVTYTNAYFEKQALKGG